MANDMTSKVKRICVACNSRSFWVNEGSGCYRCLSCRRTDALRRGCDLPEFMESV